MFSGGRVNLRCQQLSNIEIMHKSLTLLIILLLNFQLAFTQDEIILEDYFRTLKSVKVEIEHKTYNFLFDTGGAITIVSPKVLAEVNKSSYGNSVGYRMSGEKVVFKLCDSLDIKIGGVNFFHPQVGIFDIMSLLPKEFEQVDGLISLKTFENSIITLNFSENKIILETETSFKEKTKNMDLIPGRFANGLNGTGLNIFLGTKSMNRLWWFLFDSGNIAHTKISSNAAQEWQLPFKENEKTEIGAYKFEIAGDSLSAPTIIDNIIYDGAFSYDFIQQSEFVISFRDKKIWKNRKK